MKKMQTKIISILILSILIGVFSFSNKIYGETTPEILVFVHDDTIYSYSSKTLPENVKVMPLSMINKSDYSKFDAIAIPSTVKIARRDFKAYFKSGIRLYIYGSVSVDEFTNKFDINTKPPVLIRGIDKENIIKIGWINFYNNNVKNNKFNIIGMRKSSFSTFLCDIDDNKNFIRNAIKAIHEDYLFSKKILSDKKPMSSPYYVQYFDDFNSWVRVSTKLNRNYEDGMYRKYNFILDTKIELQSKSPIKSIKYNESLLADTMYKSVFPTNFTMIPFKDKILKYKETEENKLKGSNPIYLKTTLDSNRKSVDFEINTFSIFPIKTYKLTTKYETKIATDRSNLNIKINLKPTLLKGFNREFRKTPIHIPNFIYNYQF